MLGQRDAQSYALSLRSAEAVIVRLHDVIAQGLEKLLCTADSLALAAVASAERHRALA